MFLMSAVLVEYVFVFKPSYARLLCAVVVVNTLQCFNVFVCVRVRVKIINAPCSTRPLAAVAEQHTTHTELQHAYTHFSLFYTILLNCRFLCAQSTMSEDDDDDDARSK